MKYCYLTSTDRPTNDFVFYKDWDEPGLYLPQNVAKLVCQECRKLDQIQALSMRYIQGDIRTRVDWIHADDGPVCVSAKGKAAVEESGAKGLIYTPFVSPRKKEFWMLTSSHKAPTEVGIEFTYGPICGTCGRYRYILGLPRIRSLQLPADEMIVFEQSVPCETEFCIQTWLIASETVTKRLKAAKISGFRCFDVDE